MNRTVRIAAGLWIAAAAVKAEPEPATRGPANATAWEETVAGAVRRGRDEGRPVLLNFHMENCGWCRVMDRQVYADAKVAERLKPFVCARVDIQRDAPTAMAYRVQSVPRTVVINRKGRIAGDQLGYVGADAFLAFLGDASRRLDDDSPELPPAPGIAQQAVIEAASAAAESLAAGATLTTQAEAFVAHPDPAVRAEAEKALLAKGDAALPLLVEAVAADYLGTRIAACRLLERLAPGEPPTDPWAPAAERAASRERWRRWLAERPRPAP